jgi:hypothetical protein
MNLRRNLTGALAWAGLVIVVAVPTVEIVRSRLLPSASALPVAVAPTEPVQPIAENTPPAPTAVAATAAVAAAPAKVEEAPAVETAAVETPAAATASPVPVAVAEPPAQPEVGDVPVVQPVSAQAPGPDERDQALDDYLRSGKKLPDYITANAPTKLGVTTVPASPAAAADDVPPQATGAAPAAIVATAPPIAAPLTPPKPMPVSARPKAEPARTVTEADLKDWKSGTLENYLKQQGLLSGSDATADAGN